MHGNNITEEAADDIAVLFSQNTNLESFSLGDNHLGTVGIKKLLKLYKLVHVSLSLVLPAITFVKKQQMTLQLFYFVTLNYNSST